MDARKGNMRFLISLLILSFVFSWGCYSVGSRTHRLRKHGPTFLKDTYEWKGYEIKDYHLDDGLYLRKIYRDGLLESELYFHSQGVFDTYVYHESEYTVKVMFDEETNPSGISVYKGSSDRVLNETYDQEGRIRTGRIYISPLKSVVFLNLRKPSSVYIKKSENSSGLTSRDEIYPDELGEFHERINHFVALGIISDEPVANIHFSDIEAKYGKWAKAVVDEPSIEP